MLFGLLAGALFTGIVGTLGATFTWDIAHTSSVSPDLEVPKWIVYLCIPLGSYLMCFRFLQVAWHFRAPVSCRITTSRTSRASRTSTRPMPIGPNLHPAPVPGGTRMSTADAPAHPTPPRWPALLPAAAHRSRRSRCGSPAWRVPNAAIIFALLVGLMLTGMPVSISLGLTVLTYLFTMTTVPIESVALKLFTGIEKFEIMAIPFFILAGNFLTHGGVARRMIRFASSMVGHWDGGLGLAGVLACALFAAVSGSSPATVVAIGSIILPAMVKQGFPARFGAGVITTSGALGILIPPSIVMVMYAVATNTSVGAAVHRRHRARPRARDHARPDHVVARAQERLPAPAQGDAGAARWRAFRESVWGLLLIVVVIGGIYTGIFTPTEAAAMSAVYAFFVAVFVYKDMPLSKVPKVLLDSANMSAMLLYIITNAVMFSYLMTSENIPQAMAAWMLDKGLGVVAFLLVVNVLLLLAGNVMEPSSIVLIMAPILFPVAIKLGIDPDPLRHHDGRQHGGRHVPSRRSASTSMWRPASPRWASPSSPSRCGRGCSRCWCSWSIVTYWPRCPSGCRGRSA